MRTGVERPILLNRYIELILVGALNLDSGGSGNSGNSGTVMLVTDRRRVKSDASQKFSEYAIHCIRDDALVNSTSPVGKNGARRFICWMAGAEIYCLDILGEVSIRSQMYR